MLTGSAVTGFITIHTIACRQFTGRGARGSQNTVEVSIVTLLVICIATHIIDAVCISKSIAARLQCTCRTTPVANLQISVITHFIIFSIQYIIRSIPIYIPITARCSSTIRIASCCQASGTLSRSSGAKRRIRCTGDTGITEFTGITAFVISCRSDIINTVCIDKPITACRLTTQRITVIYKTCLTFSRTQRQIIRTLTTVITETSLITDLTGTDNTVTATQYVGKCSECR